MRRVCLPGACADQRIPESREDLHGDHGVHGVKERISHRDHREHRVPGAEDLHGGAPGARGERRRFHTESTGAQREDSLWVRLSGTQKCSTKVEPTAGKGSARPTEPVRLKSNPPRKGTCQADRTCSTEVEPTPERCLRLADWWTVTGAPAPSSRRFRRIFLPRVTGATRHSPCGSGFSRTKNVRLKSSSQQKGTCQADRTCSTEVEPTVERSFRLAELMAHPRHLADGSGPIFLPRVPRAPRGDS